MSDSDVVIDALGCLTPREAEAVLWVAQGKTSWEAGRILGVASSTLDAHVANAAAKLRASNRAHLVARAFVTGVLVPAAKKIAAALLLIALLGDNHDVAARVRRVRLRRGRDDSVTEIFVRTPGGAA